MTASSARWSNRNLPFALDPETLAPLGYDDFAGAMTGLKFTAHPKIDPETGEMVFFAYSVGGFFTKTMLYGVIDRAGKVTRLEKFEAPFSSMVHDFLVTRNYVLFPILPLTGSLERAMSGKPAYAWEPAKGAYVGVLKRDADIATLRWFQGDPCYVFHPMNAFEEDGKIVADVMQSQSVPFPDADGTPNDPAKVMAHLHRWTFDLVGNSDRFRSAPVDDLAAEFPRLDERFAGLAYRHGYYAAATESWVGFDMLVHFDHATGKRIVYHAPKGDVLGEPVFVPRKPGAAEGDGYLLATIYRGAENRSDLLVFDAGGIDRGPIAEAQLSHRVPYGFHGNWRPA